MSRNGGPLRPRIVPSKRPSLIWPIAGVVLMAILAYPAFLWFVCRWEVENEQILVLVNKTGDTLPPELADEFGDQVVLYP